jgi:ABC-type multidrug transport system fused ATPase/permease subunit
MPPPSQPSEPAGPGHGDASDPASRYQEFARLGRGGESDTLSLRLIVRLLVRCVPFLRPVVRPLVGMVVCGALLMLVVALPGINIVNIFWNGILEGQPISELQARMVWLPADTDMTTGDVLSPEQRKLLLRKLVYSVSIMVVLFSPFFMGLIYWRIWILQQINQHLRLQMLDRLQALSLRFHAEQRIGDSIYRMFQDSSMVTQLLHVLFLHPLETLARFSFSLALIVLWDPRLALLLLLSWPLALLIGHRFARPLRVGFRGAREANSALTSRIQETLSGLKVIKAYGAEAVERKRFEAASIGAFDAAFAARSRFVGYKVLIFYAVGLFLVLGVGAATGLAREGAPLFGERFMVAMGFAALNMGIWDLGFYNNYKDRFGDGTRAIHSMMDVWGGLQDVATGLDRTFELLDLQPEVEDAPDAVPLPRIQQGIRYRNVSFHYESDRPVLEDVDFEVATGQVMAIVGPTGSGKSTLVSLLLRLYDPERGAIELDGRDIRGVTMQSLRDQISIALQENLLFGATVRDNIRYAVPGASDEAVREAARVACADEFIEALPDGYDTMLGERGTKLSTGQRQRLSIARAILKDAPVLILDEPTASLDAETEQRVLRNLAQWGEGRVIFLITHRLSTIRMADTVGVIDGGRLTEHGSHDELMAAEGGGYRGLVETERGSLAAANEPGRASA